MTSPRSRTRATLRAALRRAIAREELTEVISMRLSRKDRQLLDDVGALIPIVPRLTLARVALRLGLEAIRKSPAQALEAK